MNNQISTATNIQGPNLSNSSGDPNKLFTNLFAKSFDINASDNDAIVAFFEKYAKTPEAGKNLAAAVIYTALAQNISPISLIEKFKVTPKQELDSYIIALLNSNRVQTSQLGMKMGGPQNPYVIRSILI